MALQGTCTRLGDRTVLHIRQSGWENSPRWTRYYQLLGTGFTLALEQMRTYVEREWGS